MITNDVSTCPKCGGDLKYYDRVTRIVRTKGRKTWKIPMRRLQCTRCGSVHRELPELIFPYKQYEAEVIIGVLEGFITCETIGFEDYPCEMTMLVSLGLGSMSDARFDPVRVDEILDRFMDHDYEPDGKGGLFTIRNPRFDMRSMEIWYQMNCYLNEIIREGSLT